MDRIEQEDLSERLAFPMKVRVLLIDDQKFITEVMRRLLDGQEDIEFHAVPDARNALQAALQWRPTVILLDVVMPDIDGFELVHTFRAHPHTLDVPIIMLSTKEDPQLKVKAFVTGANDYLIKFPDKLELLARLRYHSSAYINHLERDKAFRALRESERKLAEANIKLQELADIDGLTGIANRRRFDAALSTEWQRALRNQRILSILLADIDFFKRYNDTYGHLAGDSCLKKVAAVLAGNLRRPADIAARYGGEEFALILPETGSDGALAVAETCLRGVEFLAIEHKQSTHAGIVTMSIGVASMIPSTGSNPADIIDLADCALYNAKNLGRNQIVRRS